MLILLWQLSMNWFVYAQWGCGYFLIILYQLSTTVRYIRLFNDNIIIIIIT